MGALAGSILGMRDAYCVGFGEQAGMNRAHRSQTRFSFAAIKPIDGGALLRLHYAVIGFSALCR